MPEKYLDLGPERKLRPGQSGPPWLRCNHGIGTFSQPDQPGMRYRKKRAGH
jgi:hypothetical protein